MKLKDSMLMQLQYKIRSNWQAIKKKAKKPEKTWLQCRGNFALSKLFEVWQDSVTSAPASSAVDGNLSQWVAGKVCHITKSHINWLAVRPSIFRIFAFCHWQLLHILVNKVRSKYLPQLVHFTYHTSWSLGLVPRSSLWDLLIIFG